MEYSGNILGLLWEYSGSVLGKSAGIPSQRANLKVWWAFRCRTLDLQIGEHPVADGKITCAYTQPYIGSISGAPLRALGCHWNAPKMLQDAL